MIRERLSGGDGPASCSTASRARCRRPTRSTRMLADLGLPLDAVISIARLARRAGAPAGRALDLPPLRPLVPRGLQPATRATRARRAAATCDLYQREDDRPETVVNRLSVYEEQTAPLIDYYRSRGLLREVDGERTPDEVYAQIVTHIPASPARHGPPGAHGRLRAARSRRPPARSRRWPPPGAVLAECHDALAAEVGRGRHHRRTSTRSPRSSSAARGGVPAFKGYPGPTPFPASICPSVNDAGRPRDPGRLRAARRATCSPSTPAWCSTAGWPTRRARTPIGTVSPDRRPADRGDARRRSSAASPPARVGNRVGDIGHAVQTEVEAAGLLGGAEPGGPRRRAARCTRSPRCRTSAAPARAPSSPRAW